jgi:hypothetical protein
MPLPEIAPEDLPLLLAGYSDLVQVMVLDSRNNGECRASPPNDDMATEVLLAVFEIGGCSRAGQGQNNGANKIPDQTPAQWLLYKLGQSYQFCAKVRGRGSANVTIWMT